MKMTFKSFLILWVIAPFFHAWAAIDSELNLVGQETAADIKSKGCQIAQKVGSQRLSEGSLSAEESMLLSQYKRDYYSHYTECLESGQWELEYFGKPASTARPIPLSSTPSSRSEYPPYSGRVIQVVDPVTLLLESGQRVRLIGIQVPAAKRAETRKFLNDTVLNQDIRLEYDREKKDAARRYLAYVSTNSDSLVNKSLIEAGLAKAEPSASSLKYGHRLLPPKTASEQAPVKKVSVTPLSEEIDLAEQRVEENQRLKSANFKAVIQFWIALLMIVLTVAGGLWLRRR